MWAGHCLRRTPAPPPPVGVGHLWVCGFAKNLWWVGPSNQPPPPPHAVVNKNPVPPPPGTEIS